jgi:hypothetical protein
VRSCSNLVGNTSEAMMSAAKAATPQTRTNLTLELEVTAEASQQLTKR